MKLYPVLPYMHVLLDLVPEFGREMYDNLEPVDYNDTEEEGDIYFIEGILVFPELKDANTIYIMPIYRDSYSFKKNVEMKVYGINKEKTLGISLRYDYDEDDDEPFTY